MSIALAATATSTSVSTSTLEEEDVPTDPFARCFLSTAEFAATRCMQALLAVHPDAGNAPIISDKDICGNDEAFGRKLVTELRRRMQLTSASGYLTFCIKYGLKYHQLDTVQENFLIKRCKHACGH